MEPDALSTFDPAPYLTLPTLTADSVVTLANALADEMPPQASAQVLGARAQLDAEREALEDAQDTRRRGTSAQTLAAEAELDQAVDGAWVDVRDTLRCKAIYARPGYETLAADPDAKIDYAALVDRARRAQALHDHLFGHEGLVFLKRKYTEQVAAMASILRIVEEDGLADELDAITGEQAFARLRDLQARYQAMVSERAARDRGSDRIKVHVTRVRQAVVLYAVTLMGMLEAGAPESVALVEDALRPIVSFREQVQRGRSASVAAEDEDADQGEPADDANPEQDAPALEDPDAAAE